AELGEAAAEAVQGDDALGLARELRSQRFRSLQDERLERGRLAHYGIEAAAGGILLPRFGCLSIPSEQLLVRRFECFNFFQQALSLKYAARQLLEQLAITLGHPGQRQKPVGEPMRAGVRTAEAQVHLPILGADERQVGESPVEVPGNERESACLRMQVKVIVVS